MSVMQLIKKGQNTMALLLVFIIAILTLLPLMNHQYFTMHDDQHIARLHLLDQAISQGVLYPRWVDTLGFGYGYPLFNFYPPLIYYVAEIFRSMGFSLATSIKLMIAVGGLIGSSGMYFFAKTLWSPRIGVLSSALFTLFGYRAITMYVRGAFAEYFALSILPWLLLGYYNLYKERKLINVVATSFVTAALLLAHPFVAVPSTAYILTFITILTSTLPSKSRKEFLILSISSGILALGLSAFFWMPSAIERQHTLVNNILLKELASYKLHFVQLHQLWYSPWGFGGSIEGAGDGMSFQIHKPYILGFIIALSIPMWMLIRKIGTFFSAKKKTSDGFPLVLFTYFLLMTVASIFLMLSQSQWIWNSIQYLQYLQFPWRLMGFLGLFVALTIGAGFYLIEQWNKKIGLILTAGLIFLLIVVQTKYFSPQQFIQASDSERTSYNEIAWRISASSFEFAPKGVATTQTALNTTKIDVNENQINRSIYNTQGTNVLVQTGAQSFNEKSFNTDATSPVRFSLHTFNFPGWRAYIDDEPTEITDNNRLKLITITIPEGKHQIKFSFEQTPVRKLATIISLLSLVLSIVLWQVTLRKKSE